MLFLLAACFEPDSVFTGACNSCDLPRPVTCADVSETAVGVAAGEGMSLTPVAAADAVDGVWVGTRSNQTMAGYGERVELEVAVDRASFVYVVREPVEDWGTAEDCRPEYRADVALAYTVQDDVAGEFPGRLVVDADGIADIGGSVAYDDLDGTPDPLPYLTYDNVDLAVHATVAPDNASGAGTWEMYDGEPAAYGEWPYGTLYGTYYEFGLAR